MTICTVCGGDQFTSRAVLWDSLVAEWQLGPAEREYVDRQQGKACSTCGANLRSIALADALRGVFCTPLLLKDYVATNDAQLVRILEINEAGSLSPFLRRMSRHVLAAYPQIDMHAMSFPDQQFDVIVHSDTLEHLANPVHALAECRRVLRRGGALCFTAPTIVGRMSRTRAGLPRSCHGGGGPSGEDVVVQTEFGADVWCRVMEAGFTSMTISAVEYPAALAFTAHA